MSCGLEAYRDSDDQISYVFPEDFDFTGYDAEFVVYDVKGGTALLNVTQAPNVNGSAISFVSNVILILIKAADVDALPENADTTLPSNLWFDLFLTNPGAIVTKIHGGVFKVFPLGAAICNA